MTPDDRADRLAEIAVELTCRVRDDSPEANVRWLDSVTEPEDFRDLCFVLAAAVPDDRSWQELTAWTRPTELAPDRPEAPHGTPAAARRHQALREPMCEDCRRYERDRKRASRQRQRTAESVHRLSTGSSTGDVADTDRQDAA